MTASRPFLWGIFRNITARKQAEAALLRQKDILDALSQTNQAIMHCTDREELFLAICRIAVVHSRFRFAWIGLLSADGRRVEPVASYGEDAGYVEQMRVSAASTDDLGRCPSCEPLADGRHVIRNDFLNDPATAPCHETARRAGVRSSGAFPIRLHGAVVGSINLYGSEPDFFTDDLLPTLDEIATAVSFALDNFVRTEALRAASQVVEASPVVLFRCRPQPGWPLEYISANVNRWGYPAATLLSGEVPFARLVYPEDLPRVGDEVERYTREGRTEFQQEYRIVTADGGVLWVVDRTHVVRSSDGRVLRYEGVLTDITERKQAEEVLRRSEEQFKTIFDQAPLGIALVDSLTGHIHAVNTRFAKIAGRTVEAMTHIDWMSITHPDDVQKDLDNMALLNAGEITGFKMEKRYLLPAGDAVWINMAIAPVTVEDKAHPQHLCMIEDITERKRSENELKQTHAALNAQYWELQEAYAKIAHAKKEWEATFDAIADPLFIHDHAFRIVRANQAYADAAGMPPAELIGKLYYEVFPKTEGPFKKCLKAMEQVVRTEEEEEEQVLGQTPGKRYRTRLFSMQDSAGKYVHSIHIMEDITERKQAENELRMAAIYARNLIEASLDPLTVTSLDGKITDVNTATEAVTGVPRERLIGSDFSEYCTEPEKARTGYLQVLAQGAVRDYPLTIRHASGHLTDVLYSATVYCNEYGAVQGVLATAWDITERKRIQEQGARMERLAALGQLLGGIAHELRNPLFIITGRLQLMKEMLANREYNEAERNIQIIEEASKRMTMITQRFLNLAKPLKPQRQECLVHDVLTQTLDFMTNELMKNRIRVVRAFAPDLPPTLSEPRQLHEVFLNIVMNAMQAMTAAHGQGTLTITTLRKDDWIETRIQDDGPGIPARHRARLFEPFFSTKPPEQGTGLGLWTVRSLLAELNGTVECESVEGQGTTFIVRIPIASSPS